MKMAYKTETCRWW